MDLYLFLKLVFRIETRIFKNVRHASIYIQMSITGGHMKTAIITGASSGLGTEFTKAVIAGYPELDEIWVVARRKERLDKFAECYPC